MDTPQNTPPADPTPPAPAPAPQNTPPAPSDPKPADPAPTPPADPAPPAPAPAPQDNPPEPEPKDILDLAKGADEQKAEADAKAKADFDAYVKAAGFENGVADAVIRKGENGAPDTTLPASEVGAILTAAKSAGIPAEKAAPMLGIVSALDTIRAEAAAKEDQTILRNLRAETAKEFGDGLAAAARDMVSGGVALFGAELWKDLTENALPLVNDKRFVRALASYGARLRNDNGGPPPASGGATGDRTVFDLASWSKGSGG